MVYNFMKHYVGDVMQRFNQKEFGWKHFRNDTLVV